MQTIDNIGIRGRFQATLLDESSEVVGTHETSNIVTYAGLSSFASALSYSGIQDVAAFLGVNTPYYLAPIYGAIGSGTSATGVTSLDTTLFQEITRSPATGNGSTVSSYGQSALCVWSFFFGASQVGYTVTEAGVYVQASPITGTLANHAVFETPFLKQAAYAMQLKVSFSIVGG